MEFDEQQLWGEGVADNHLAAGTATIRVLAALSDVHCLWPLQRALLGDKQELRRHSSRGLSRLWCSISTRQHHYCTAKRVGCISCSCTCLHLTFGHAQNAWATSCSQLLPSIPEKKFDCSECWHSSRSAGQLQAQTKQPTWLTSHAAPILMN